MPCYFPTFSVPSATFLSISKFTLPSDIWPFSLFQSVFVFCALGRCPWRGDEEQKRIQTVVRGFLQGQPCTVDLENMTINQYSSSSCLSDGATIQFSSSLGRRCATIAVFSQCQPTVHPVQFGQDQQRGVFVLALWRETLSAMSCGLASDLLTGLFSSCWRAIESFASVFHSSATNYIFYRRWLRARRTSPVVA